MPTSKISDREAAAIRYKEQCARINAISFNPNPTTDEVIELLEWQLPGSATAALAVTRLREQDQILKQVVAAVTFATGLRAAPPAAAEQDNLHHTTP